MLCKTTKHHFKKREKTVKVGQISRAKTSRDYRQSPDLTLVNSRTIPDRRADPGTGLGPGKRDQRRHQKIEIQTTQAPSQTGGGRQSGR